MRRNVGTVCFLSFILGLVFVGYYAYIVMAPFFRGGEVRHYIDCCYSDGEGTVGVDSEDLARQVAANGIGASDGALLRGVVTGTRPHRVERAWDAYPQLVDTWRTYKSSSPVTDLAWAAVADASGRVVATYPAGLASKMDWVRAHSASGWYGALAPGKQASERPERIEVIPVVKPHEPQVAIGSIALARRPYSIIAVIPPGARVEARHLSLADALLLAGCSFLLGAILLPIWVAMDADWRGMRGGAWAVLVVVTGVIGFAAYLLARLAPPKQCPNCGELVHSGYKRCPACGVTLLAKCPKCGRKLRPGWQFCPRCTGERPEEPTERTPEPEQTQGTQTVEPVSVRLEPDASDALPEASHFALGVSVRDAGTGVPIVGAIVSIVGSTSVEGRTGEKGYFKARALLSGAHTVSASAQGYEPAQMQFGVGGEERSSVQLALDAIPGTIGGRVLARSTLRPIAAARVFVDSARLENATTSDQDGVFMLDGIAPGPYTVCAECHGYARQTRLAEVEPGQHATVGFALEVAEAAEQEVDTNAVQ